MKKLPSVMWRSRGGGVKGGGLAARPAVCVTWRCVPERRVPAAADRFLELLGQVAVAGDAE